jgi:hypothetical protein
MANYDRRGTSLNHQQLLKWIKLVYNTSDEEMGCEQFQMLLPVYVDARVAGNIPELPIAEIGLHIEQCPDCADEFESLYHVLALEAKGTLPGSAELLDNLSERPDPESLGTIPTAQI